MAFRFVLLASLAALPCWVRAQDRLPNLTPSVFEITGELEINLPQLERQPLSGFGPPPRTYVVPAERPVATRPYDLAYDGLPPFRLAAPSDPAIALIDNRYLRVEGGLGTEVGRYGRLNFASPLLFADVDYDGLGSTTDVVTGGTPDPFVTFNRFNGRGGIRTSGTVVASLTGLVHYNDFSLPGLSDPADMRTISMFGGEAEVATGAAAPTPAGASISITRAKLDDTLGGISSSTSDTHFRGRVFAELLNRLVRIEGGGGTSSFIDGSSGTDLADYSAGLLLQAYSVGGLQLKAGARVLGYRTSVQNGDATSTLFAPVASVDVPLGVVGRLFAFTDPKVEDRGVFDLLEENPFTQIGFVAPNINTVDGQGGIELRSGSAGLKVYGGLTISPTRLFFERNPSGLFNADYGKARTIVGGADVSFVSIGGIEFSAGGELRNGTLTEADQSLPYYASQVGRVGADVPFLNGKGSIGLSAYFEGERPVDRVGTRMLSGFATMGLQISYEFANGISVIARGERLIGDAERWEGFPQKSTTILGGIRLVR